MRLVCKDSIAPFGISGKHADTDALSRCALATAEGDTPLSHEDVLSFTPFDFTSFAEEELGDPRSYSLIRHIHGSVLFLNRGLIR